MLMFFAEPDDQQVMKGPNASHDSSISLIGSAQAFHRPTPVHAICRVVVPIHIMQDELSPYQRHRPPYTATLMNNLYETLRYKLDLEECWAKYFDVMLWATLSGAYISRGNSRDQELWFSIQVVIGAREAKGENGQLKARWEWNEIKSLLKRFYWSEELVGEEFKVLVHPEPRHGPETGRLTSDFCHRLMQEIYESLSLAINAPDDTESAIMNKLIAAACGIADLHD